MFTSLISTLAPSPDETTAAEFMSRPLWVLVIVVGAMIATRLIHFTVRRVVRRVSQRSIAHPSRWWRTRARYGEYETTELGESRRQQRADDQGPDRAHPPGQHHQDQDPYHLDG